MYPCIKYYHAKLNKLLYVHVILKKNVFVAKFHVDECEGQAKVLHMINLVLIKNNERTSSKMNYNHTIKYIIALYGKTK